MNLLMSFVWVVLVGVALVGMLLLVGGAIAVAILDSDVDRLPTSFEDATIQRANQVLANASTPSRTGSDSDLGPDRRHQRDLVPMLTGVHRQTKPAVIAGLYPSIRAARLQPTEARLARDASVSSDRPRAGGARSQ
jgi:hypothetical protein